MMDGDGAEMVEMMAGQPGGILSTIYNGSGFCLGCGSLMSPVVAMYSGDKCSDCSTRRFGKALKNRMA